MSQRPRAGYAPLHQSPDDHSAHRNYVDTPWPWQSARWKRLAAFGVLGLFLLYVLLVGIGEEARGAAERIIGELATDKSYDFEQYVHLRTLKDGELAFDDSSNRMIIVGDIHGRNDSLSKLLSKLSYDPTSDTLLHVGDVLAKGPLSGSLSLLSYMSQNNILGVRGNHDQRVIGWHIWISRVLSHTKGPAWLEELEKRGKKGANKYLKMLKHGHGNHGHNMGGETAALKKDDWRRIPDNWEFLSEHYEIARAMDEEQANYLKQLPLTIHIPRLHAFLVHAGMLPIDPTKSADSLRQPLARVPDVDSAAGEEIQKSERLGRMRTKQEGNVVVDIPQNGDPWVLLNMRSILDDNSITRDSKEGDPWTSLWNSIVSRCGGFDYSLSLSDRQKEDDVDEDGLIDFSSSEDDDDGDDEEDDGDVKTLGKKPKVLPCYPSTVIYGHSASRGLDIERWSKGLDTGCVYGRRLTALVLSPSSLSSSSDAKSETESEDADDDDDDDVDREMLAELLKSKKMRFGDKDGSTARAKIVSVRC